jgi:branched-chain amino acid transport system ATP-binding protein
LSTKPPPPDPPPGADPARLRVERVCVEYGRTTALRPLSFDLPAGGLVMVVGPNGAGKTSMLKALAGLVPAGGGTVRLDGADVTRLPTHRRLRAGISLVPEGRGTLPGLSVRDNLELGWHSLRSPARRDRADRFARVLDLFPVLGQRMSQDCSTLSGGQMQMLAIARALLARPKVLLLDEPSLGLSPIATADVYQALEQLGRDGMAMVLVEQKAVPLRRVPDTVLVLQRGRLIHTGHGSRPVERDLAAMYLGGEAGGEAGGETGGGGPDENGTRTP